MIPCVVSYGETLTWTRSPFITLILCFFILPERTPLTMTWLSHSISMVPPPSTRVTIPSSWIKSFRLNGPPSKYRFFLLQTLSSIFGASVKTAFQGIIEKPLFPHYWHHPCYGCHSVIYSPYVNKPRDYFVRGSGFFTQPRYTGKVKPLSRKRESTKTRKRKY